MTGYVIQLEGRETEFPTSIIIIEKRRYEEDIGLLENERNLKIVDKYPSELNKKLKTMLGEPVRIGLESEIFTIRREHRNCIKRMFENI